MAPRKMAEQATSGTMALVKSRAKAEFMTPQGFEDNTTFQDWAFQGRGAEGDTWRARMVPDGAEVIVKVCPPAPDNGFARLHKTFATQGLNNHAALQRFRVVIATDGHEALVFDFVEGHSLRHHLAEAGSMPIEAVRKLGVEVLSGLDALHRAKLIHRDVTPENVILGAEGAVLIDYGAIGELTRHARLGQTTIGGDFAGKLLYAAPEQLSGAPQSGAVDVWALGAVLYEAATGNRLRTEATLADIFRSSLDAPDLDAVPVGLRPALEAMLAPDPAMRPNAEAAKALLSKEATPARSMPIPDDWDAMLQKPFGVKKATTVKALGSLSATEAPAPLDDPFGAPGEVASALEPAPAPPPPAPAPTPAPEAIDAPRPPKSAGPRLSWLWLLLPVTFGGLAAAVYFSGTLAADELTVPYLALGLIAGGSFLAGLAAILWRHTPSKPPNEPDDAPFWAASLLEAPDARDLLTRTILVNIEALYAERQSPGGGLLAVQMAALAKEYSDAETSDQRMEALRMLNDLHARAADAPSQFWQGWDSAAGRIASLASLLAGLVALAEGVRRLF